MPVKTKKNLWAAAASLQKYLDHHGWLNRKVYQVISSNSQKYFFAKMGTVR